MPATGPSFEHVRRGDRPKADEHNEIIRQLYALNSMGDDAAGSIRTGAGKFLASGKPKFRDLDVVFVRNDTGGDLTGEHPILGLGDLVKTPDDSAGILHTWPPQIKGVTPADGTHNGLFAVLDGPSQSGKFQSAIVSGLALCDVYNAGSSHKFADIDDGSTARLTSSASGSARIIDREDVAAGATGWALVRLSNRSEAEEDVVIVNSSGCGCSCIDNSYAVIAIGDSCSAPAALVFAPICQRAAWPVLWVSGTTYRSAVHPVNCDGTDYCIYVEIVVSGTGIGDVVASVKTSPAGTTLQTWSNATPWNPRCRVRMIITGDPCTQCDYVAEPCLAPLTQDIVDAYYGRCAQVCYADNPDVFNIDCGGSDYPCEYLIGSDVLEYQGGCEWRGSGTGPCGAGEWVLTISGGVATLVHEIASVATATWITIGAFDRLCTITLVNVELEDCECDSALEFICVHPRDTVCTSCSCPTGKTYSMPFPQGIDSTSSGANICQCGNGWANFSMIHSSLEPRLPIGGLVEAECLWVGILEHSCTGTAHHAIATLTRDSANQITVGLTLNTGSVLGSGTQRASGTYRLTDAGGVGCDGPWTLNLVTFNSLILCDDGWPATLDIT